VTDHQIVSRDEWVDARRRLLAREKDFLRLRDELSRERRELPWERVTKSYVFDGAAGKETLSDLFAGRSQLIVYHFMFAPDSDTGCRGCSFWADNYNGVDVHLAHRDTALVAVSRAPLAKIEAYKKRMGWTFRWVSSAGGDFNFDFGVSFDPAERVEGERNYNYGSVAFGGDEAPGLSAFRRGDDGVLYHTYSTYSRGLDMFNAAYQMLDITAKGRDEADLPWPMAWLKRHDRY
jgi:predicted dithiol-disulfide oxidoreductase (DUF899 family)